MVGFRRFGNPTGVVRVGVSDPWYFAIQQTERGQSEGGYQARDEGAERAFVDADLPRRRASFLGRYRRRVHFVAAVHTRLRSELPSGFRKRQPLVPDRRESTASEGGYRRSESVR